MTEIVTAFLIFASIGVFLHINIILQLGCKNIGQVSFLFFDDEEVKPGLPIYPKLYNKKSNVIAEPRLYACTNCAEVLHLTHQQACSRCNREEWVAALSDKRIK